jgi:hypothetical protein
MKNYFAILEIPEDSTVDEIKQAYRRLAKVYHPDVNRAFNAHEKFLEISEAYEMLMHRSSEKKREHENAEEDQINYEEFLRQVREAAKRQARMKYEKFAREHEALRESGLYDVGLFFQYALRVVVPLLSLALISLPFFVAVSEKSIMPVFYLFFSWLFGGILLWDAFQRRKGYFKLGQFYYSRQKIKQLFNQTNEVSNETCFYCKGQKGNSIPFEINVIRVKDIKLKNEGALQHSAGYNRNEFAIKFPRSRKALIVHSVVSGVKLLSILVALFFIPFGSIVWRLIGGCFIGWALSSILLVIVQTRSKVSYLLSYGILIKIVIWIGVLASISSFDLSRFDIRTSGYVQLTVAFMLLGDAFIEQLLKMPRQHLFRPFLKRYDSLARHIDNNCQLYLEVPVWTTIYPLLRWIF